MISIWVRNFLAFEIEFIVNFLELNVDLWHYHMLIPWIKDASELLWEFLALACLHCLGTLKSALQLFVQLICFGDVLYTHELSYV